ncbi:MAG: alpha/beta fold hydrolase [Alphaproteobacteria bacterium]|nr:alpha/beta fold hydrolase [Alphaproteobacteria bacterium]MCB9929210.1 alpha/beta fold hydrolase [Alphaproteobacteria bacterium]
MFHMNPISISLSQLERTAFDAVVIGSGYGGAIAAARLAEAGHNVCLLERGREILPGDYPTDLAGVLAETQVTTSKFGKITKNTPNGLLDLRVNDDMNVAIGCGLGGTSLINANVALETDPKTFCRTDADGQYHWPSAYRKDGVLDAYYTRARKMLGTVTLPQEYNPNKLKALYVSAGAIGQPCKRAPINVTFKDGRNAAGVEQKACTMCGDCCAGCNYGAKNTTLMNYLPYAHAHGARIVTEAAVDHLARGTDGEAKWVIHVKDMSAGNRRDEADRNVRRLLRADIVVVAAGTLGSTEILLRSQAKGLALSRQLGERFSGNGDVLSFGFDADWDRGSRGGSAGERQPVWGIGAGAEYPLKRDSGPEFRPGPCITGVIEVDMAADAPVEQAAVIEEGVAPGALSPIYPAMFFLSEALHGQLTRFPDIALRLQDAKDLGTALLSGTGLSEASYHGAMSRTQSFLLMSHDSSGGKIVLDETTDTVRVDWPGVGREFPYERDNALLRDAADGIWANSLPSPLWHPNFGNRLITVHPVGGCCMGETSAAGVVNADCEVFRPSTDDAGGTAVYDGLLVCDGSVMPTSLGLNPLLTISAVAERAMERLLDRVGRKPGAERRPQPLPPAVSPEAAPLSDGTDEWTEAVQLLTAVKDWLKDLGNKIDNADYTEAANTIYHTIERARKTFKIPISKDENYDFWFYLEHSDELTRDIRPSIRDVMEILDCVLDTIRTEPYDYAAVIAVLEKAFGDFSPNLSFSETMTGFVAAPGGGTTSAISDPFAVAARVGESQGLSLEADFRVRADSVRQLLANPDHKALLSGSVKWKQAPQEEAVAFAVTDGSFRLLKKDAATVEAWQMIYAGKLKPRNPVAGKSADYRFTGTKTLKRRPDSNWWGDLTTLYVDIAKDEDPSQIVARGVIRLGIQDFLNQMQTLESKFCRTLKTYDGASIYKKLFLDMVPYPKGYGGVRWGILHTDLKKPEIRHQFLLKTVDLMLKPGRQSPLPKKIASAAMRHFQFEFAAFFANLIFRTYGGMLSYLNDFPRQDFLAGKVIPMPAANGAPLRYRDDVRSECYRFFSAPNVELQLIRYNGGDRGPVILAPGFANVAQCFAIETVDKNLVDCLCAAKYDVWLFDYRGSPALGEVSLKPFDIDDIALEDWPAAVDYVLAMTGAKNLQVVAHCMGSMSLQMSLLSGRLATGKVRSAVCSQLTVHPVNFWFNQMKADTHIGSLIVHGLPKELVLALDGLVGPDAAQLFAGRKTIDTNSGPRTPGPVSPQDQVLDLLTWPAPFPNGIPCYSPTCHRAFSIYGPAYVHAQLNEATHDAIQTIFGNISTTPFNQLATILRKGEAVTAKGENLYLPHPERLQLPIHFISGAINEEFTPDTTLRTYNWLRKNNPEMKDEYTRRVIPNYGHLDCFIGKNASKDVFEDIVDRLDKHARKP